MVKRVCLVSGGTGGHLLPAVVLARALRDDGHDSLVVTEGREAERAMLERFDCPSSTLPVGAHGVGLPVRLLGATVKARRFLRDQDFDLVVGTGGRATVPFALAAKSLGLPVTLMEQNVVTGRANRMLLPLAKRIYLGLPPRRPQRRALVTGTPVRVGLGEVDPPGARRSLGLQQDVPVVLVTGGSQGARPLNEIVPDALCGLRRPLQVLHLSGPDSDAAVRMRYAAGEPYGVTAMVRPYAFDMVTFYAAADLVICRGGGGTVAELATSGRAAIVVPYPYHRDRQQYFNGKVLEGSDAAVVVEQKDLKRELLSELVGKLLEPGRGSRMGRNARALGHADSCRRIMDDLKNLAALD